MSIKRKYNKLIKDSDAWGDIGDCSVIALAIVCDIEYKEAYHLCNKFGRINNTPMDHWVFLTILGYCGYSIEPFYNIIQPNGRKYTNKSIIKTLDNTPHLLLYNKHIAACVNHIIYDWTSDKRIIIEHVMRVQKI